MNIMAEKSSNIIVPNRTSLHLEKNKVQREFNNFNQPLITRLWGKKIEKASKKIKKECPYKTFRQGLSHLKNNENTNLKISNTQQENI